MTTIKQTYLMWVGSESYPHIKDYVDEAQARGVSKRLPNKALAQAMLEPGTLVFLAHDEGEHEDCQACMGIVGCSACEGAGKRTLIRGMAPSDCKACLGAGSVLSGTGGSVVVDGKEMTWRKYAGLNRSGKEFNTVKHILTDKNMCKDCGGSGQVPLGKVFGCFLPQSVEYILDGTETEDVRKMLVQKGFRLVTPGQLKVEAARLCGRRHCGVYAVSDVSPEAQQAAIHELVKAGKIDPKNVDMKGGFIQFVEPVEITTKRFRGIAHWEMPAGVKREADLIMDDVA